LIQAGAGAQVTRFPVENPGSLHDLLTGDIDLLLDRLPRAA
jgi:hypothetical protein